MDWLHKKAFWMSLASIVDIILKGVPPLNLESSIKDGIKYIKAYGGTKLSYDIPVEYTQVEGAIKYGTYQSLGKFNTGLKITNDDVKIEVLAKAGNLETQGGATTMGSFYCCQARAANGAAITGISGSSTGNTIMASQYGTAITSEITRTEGHIYFIRYEYKNGTQTLYVKDLTDNTEDTQTGTYTFTAPTSNFYIFGNSVESNRVNGGNAVYSCKIWDSGTLVFDSVSVKRDSDGLVSLYDKISNTLLEPVGLFEAGAITTPTPSDPMDIYCNNGALKILDKSQWTIFTNPTSVAGQGVFISTDGKWYAVNDRGAGVAIPLTIGKQYTLVIHKKTAGLGTILRYGQSPQATPTLTGIQLTDWYRGTIADGQMISFVAKLPYLVMQLARAFIEAGGVDEAIEVLEAQGTVETINVHTKNLLDPSKGEYNTIRQYRWYYSDGYTLKAGKTYTLSCDGNVTVYIMKKSDNTSLATGTDKTTYAPTEDIVVYFRIYKSGSLPETFNAQLEIGNTATAYEPYYDGGTAVVANLFKIGNYVDTQEILTGLINHQLGILVLKGDEAAGWNKTGTSVFRTQQSTLYPADFASNPNNNIAVCSHFKVTPVSAYLATAINDGEVGWNTNGAITFRNDSITTIDDWESWLAAQYAAGTPVIVVYPLATAQDEVSPVPQTMQTVAGDNQCNIVQSGINGLEVEVKYTKG